MHIVIDIPKDVIESAKSSPNYYPTYLFEMIWIAIRNGTPLPKGHGELKILWSEHIEEDKVYMVTDEEVKDNIRRFLK